MFNYYSVTLNKQFNNIWTSFNLLIVSEGYPRTFCYEISWCNSSNLPNCSLVNPNQIQTKCTHTGFYPIGGLFLASIRFNKIEAMCRFKHWILNQNLRVIFHKWCTGNNSSLIYLIFCCYNLSSMRISRRKLNHRSLI